MAGKNISSHQGFVYFLRPVGTQHVKIGWALDVRRRVAELQTGNARNLEVIATVPGDRLLERQLHLRFKRHQVRREWFDLADPIREYLEQHGVRLTLRRFREEGRATLSMDQLRELMEVAQCRPE